MVSCSDGKRVEAGGGSAGTAFAGAAQSLPESAGSISNGDPEWFERLYRNAYGPALVYARRLVGHADADDVVQEAFMRLAKYKNQGTQANSASLNGTQPIGTNFVLAMTRNVAFSALNARIRERERREARVNRSETSREAKPGADSSIDVAERHLSGLTESQREALILLEVMGLSEAQTSLVMHISRPVVNAKKKSAVRALRAMAKE